MTSRRRVERAALSPMLISISWMAGRDVLWAEGVAANQSQALVARH